MNEALEIVAAKLVDCLGSIDLNEFVEELQEAIDNNKINGSDEAVDEITDVIEYLRAEVVNRL